MYSKTITLLEKKIINNGNKAFYLVLKKKDFADEIIDNLKDEVEKRFHNFIREITPKLEKLNFEDPETSLKYLLIKGLIKILNNMEKEKSLNLSEEDRKIINDIFKEDDNKDSDDENKNQKKFNIKKKNDSGNGLDKTDKKDNINNKNHKNRNNN